MIKNSYPTEELPYEYQTHHSQQQTFLLIWDSTETVNKHYCHILSTSLPCILLLCFNKFKIRYW